jgi:hypothetical protein
MTTQGVTQKRILEELRGLEPSYWEDVLKFIGYLKHRGVPEQENVGQKDMTARDLLGSGWVGIWADREDIGDSLTFARQLRRQAQQPYSRP